MGKFDLDSAYFTFANTYSICTLHSPFPKLIKNLNQKLPLFISIQQSFPSWLYSDWSLTTSDHCVICFFYSILLCFIDFLTFLLNVNFYHHIAGWSTLLFKNKFDLIWTFSHWQKCLSVPKFLNVQFVTFFKPHIT